MLREVINEYIEHYAPGEKSIRTLIPTLRQIVADTAQQRNEWDDSPKGLTLKAMKRTVATHIKQWWLVVASQDVSSLSLSSPVAPSPHIFPIKNEMCIISRLVRRCHRRRRSLSSCLMPSSSPSLLYHLALLPITMPVKPSPSSLTSLPVALSPRVSQSLG